MADAPNTPAPSIGEAYLQQVQSGGSPTAVPQPDSSAPASPAVPNPESGQPVAPAPVQAAPAPSPEQRAAAAQNAKHTLVGRMFQSLTQGGSGSSASNLWRSVISGALIGMGAAEDAPVIHGPYGDIRSSSMVGAAGRAYAAVKADRQNDQDRQQKQDQIDKQNKQRAFENQLQMDDLSLRKASDARAQQESIRASVEHEKRMTMLDQSIAVGNWQAAQRAAETAEQQVNYFNALQEVHANALAGPDGKTLQFKTHSEAEAAAHDNPKFFIGDFQTRTAFNPEAQKYEVYRVPDEDIKNVQLKDPVSGQLHQIKRMPVRGYLDFLTSVQNLKKGQLSTEEAGLELNRLQTQIHDEDLYGSALNGDLDYSKVSNQDRARLYARAAKDSQAAMRSRSEIAARLAKLNENLGTADPAALSDAKEQLAEAADLSRTYGTVLSRLHGNPAPNPNQVSPNVKTAVDAISHLPKKQQAGQIDASSKLSPAEKQAAKQALGLK